MRKIVIGKLYQIKGSILGTDFERVGRCVAYREQTGSYLFDFGTRYLGDRRFHDGRGVENRITDASTILPQRTGRYFKPHEVVWFVPEEDKPDGLT